MLIEMLNILENFDLSAIGHNSIEYIRIVAEAMKIATIDKDTNVGDQKFFNVPMGELTSKAYAVQQADQIKHGEKTNVERFNNGGQESKNTTQVTVVDADGNCVTMTHTLGQPSGVVTDGLALVYNGAMTVFEPRSGSDLYYDGQLASDTERHRLRHQRTGGDLGTTYSRDV